MNKKLAWLLRPSYAICFVVMGCFVVLSLAMKQYMLAAVEAVLTAALVAYYVYRRSVRNREIQTYLHAHLHTIARETAAEPPFPLVTARLGDGTIVYANDSFKSISGYKDVMMEVRIGEILPGFDLNWLASGKQEYPYDVTIGGRRYRACGTTIRTELPGNFVTAALYGLLNDRLLAGKSMIISTNLNVDEIARRYSPQIASRLQGSFKNLVFLGNDIRVMKNRGI